MSPPYTSSHLLDMRALHLLHGSDSSHLSPSRSVIFSQSSLLEPKMICLRINSTTHDCLYISLLARHP